MKILATGAAGTVGSYLPPQVVATDKDTLDVADRSSVAAGLDEHGPDCVLHLAAETDVDFCEQETDRAYLTNTLGTRNVAQACALRDIVLVYISTAGVFGGAKPDPYHEFDPPNPANVYGWSKLAGEHLVQQFASRSYIVRAGWMLGGGPEGEKKFIAKMLDRAERTGRIEAVDDKRGSPTFARDLVAGVLRLLERDAYGLYHMTNVGSCTRYDVAMAVNDRLGHPYEVIPVPSSRFPLPAPRARSEAMDNLVLRLSGWGDWMPSWQEALEQYLGAEWSAWRAGAAA